MTQKPRITMIDGQYVSYVGLGLDDDLECSDPPRSEFEYPYNFDSYTVWGGKVDGVNGSVYSDRLMQWDNDKFSKLVEKHFPDGTRWAEAEKTEAFLREYNEDPTLTVTRVIKCCNWSNGYPLWRIDYIWNQAKNKV